MASWNRRREKEFTTPTRRPQEPSESRKAFPALSIHPSPRGPQKRPTTPLGGGGETTGSTPQTSTAYLQYPPTTTPGNDSATRGYDCPEIRRDRLSWHSPSMLRHPGRPRQSLGLTRLKASPSGSYGQNPGVARHPGDRPASHPGICDRPKCLSCNAF